MNKLLQNPTYKANIGYNGFPMNQLVKFTTTTGELLPVYFDLLHPGDKVTCSEELKTRTLPLKSPAMCSITENFDWFFVPMEQIYKLFGSWYFRIDDHSSSIFDFDTIYDAMPSIPASVVAELAAAIHDRTDPYFGASHSSGFRLSEFLSIPLKRIYDDSESPNAIQPMFACAYQKIYFDYYRIPDREAVNPLAYSLDKFYDTGSVTLTSAKEMFTLRYAPLHKDFFTNIFVSPLFGQYTESGIGQHGNQALVGVSDLFSQWLTGGTKNLSVFDQDRNSADSSVTGVLPTQVGQNLPPTSGSSYTAATKKYLEQALSPTSIRTSFALQKLLEVTRRAGKHYDAQQLAHFGVKLPQGINGEVTFIGSHSSKISIGDVISTANTDTGVLGQQAGKGYGYNKSGSIKFTAPCHGILMCIYNAVPDIDYTNDGLDRLHTLISPADWYRPEFDNLGMQPLFMYQANFQPAEPVDNVSILGWQYRYSEIKCKYNRVIGGLKDGNNLSFWTTQKTMLSNRLNYFLASPQFLNQIMEVGYSPTADNPFNSDPLIHECYFNVSKASKMSVYGLEQL